MEYVRALALFARDIAELTEAIEANPSWEEQRTLLDELDVALKALGLAYDRTCQDHAAAKRAA